MPKVLISIVTFNSSTDIVSCLRLVEDQSYRDYEVIVVDNNSQDDTATLISRNWPDLKLIRNRDNLGFAAGHNLAIKQSYAPFVLVLNPDVNLQPNFLGNLLEVMNINQKLGSVSGKLYKLGNDLPSTHQVDIIDSTGIMIKKSGQASDRGQSQKDTGQFDHKKDIFGPSGAAALYRREALESVKYMGEYFDQEFFAFKEDVDLAWRLRLAGWQSQFVPSALAHHKRSAGYVPGSIRQNRRSRSNLINYYSYRNNLYLIHKNFTSVNRFKFLPYIIWLEIRKFVYLLFFEPKSLRGLMDFFCHLKLIRKKRKFIQDNIKITSEEINAWFQ